MEDNINIGTTSTINVDDNNIQLDTPVVEIESSDSNATTIASIETPSYVITNSSLFTNILTKTIPDWLSDYITAVINTAIMSLSNSLDSLKLDFNTLEEGVNNSIVSINNSVESLNGEFSSYKSELNDNVAAINEVALARVTEDEAVAIIQDQVGSKFLNDNGEEFESYVTSLTKTVATDTLASSETLFGLTASITDPNSGNAALAASLLTKEKVLAGKVHKIAISEWNSYVAGNFEILFGMYKQSDTSDGEPDDDSNIYWQYVGDELGDYFGENGWVKLNGDPAVGSIEDTGWIGYSSKILVGSDGKKTGYQFLGSSGDASEFIIYADTFKIQQNDDKKAAFSIVDGKLTFLGTLQADEFQVGINIISDNFYIGDDILYAIPNGFVMQTKHDSEYGGYTLIAELAKLGYLDIVETLRLTTGEILINNGDNKFVPIIVTGGDIGQSRSDSSYISNIVDLAIDPGNTTSDANCMYNDYKTLLFLTTKSHYDLDTVTYNIAKIIYDDDDLSEFDKFRYMPKYGDPSIFACGYTTAGNYDAYTGIKLFREDDTTIENTYTSIDGDNSSVFITTLYVSVLNTRVTILLYSRNGKTCYYVKENGSSNMVYNLKGLDDIDGSGKLYMKVYGSISINDGDEDYTEHVTNEFSVTILNKFNNT